MSELRYEVRISAQQAGRGSTERSEVASAMRRVLRELGYRAEVWCQVDGVWRLLEPDWPRTDGET